MLASALLSFATVGRAAEPGYVDLGKFSPAEGCQFVEVNLHAPLLKFASIFVDKEEPEAAALIRSLKHVRVNVVGFNDETRGETTERVRSIRKELATQGWTQVVTVQGERFAFAQGESLHTENSHKFTVESLRELACEAGLRPGPVWIDDDGLFSVHWLHAPA